MSVEVKILADMKRPEVNEHQAEKGTLAVLDNYAPVMYAITPKRLAELLALEAAARQPNDVALDDSLYDDVYCTFFNDADRLKSKSADQCEVTGEVA